MVSVTESNLRQGSFKTLYDLISSNKISGSTVYSGFPERSPQFPLYAIYPPEVSGEGQNKDNHSEYFIDFEIELWATSDQLKVKVDEMKDNLQTTLINNQSTFESNNLYLRTDWFSDEGTDSPVFNENKYHIGTVIVGLKLK